MDSYDRKFKELMQDRINELFLEAQMSLAVPATNELSTNLHEIGLIRGYMKACKELYDECDEIMKETIEPEKKNDQRSGTEDL